MTTSGKHHGTILTAVFWTITLSIPVVAMVGIIFTSYWTIPPFRVEVEGDPLFAYDPEIGYVASPNGSTTWKDYGPSGDSALKFHIYTDRRGARVSHRGQQVPDNVDILLVGDSFTWGYGVDQQETFAFTTSTALGASAANLALAGYGTTQSLQMLRRNRDLTPKLVLFPLTSDQLWRNISPCSRSRYPFCLDYSHVAWDEKGEPFIARPWSDGVARVRLQMQLERSGLDPLTWISHGVDVMVARLRSSAAQAAAMDNAKQDAALKFLIEQMAITASEMKAMLLIVFLPYSSMSPAPEMLSQSAGKLGYRFFDLSQAFLNQETTARTRLFLPNDSHPSAAGHDLIAQELSAFIRKEKLLPR